MTDELAAHSVNPATGETLRSYPYATAKQVEKQLKVAQSGRIAWRTMALTARASLLLRMADALRADADLLARMITAEMGKLIGEANAEIEKCAALCEWYAQHGPALLADEAASVAPAEAYVSYAPLGIVLGIMPWNFPIWQVMRAAVPIILGGNGFILKHASNVMGCAYMLEQCWKKAGLPEGAFHVLNIPSTQVEALIADPAIAAVTLTGSVRAGALVAAAAGKALKKSVLELGGSDPFIVLADADIDAAVKAAIKARYHNAGQVCIAAKRFILEAPIAKAFTTGFVEAARYLNLGDPMQPDTTLAPLARADLRETLQRQVEASIAAGATCLLGGTTLHGRGFFYPATILENVTPGMAVFDEETFGPVAALITAKDADHAITLANQSAFGLSSNLWGGDIVRAKALAVRLETGGVFINGFSASDPRVPIGGVKQSGYGRELSHFGIHEFVNAKTVWINTN